MSPSDSRQLDVVQLTQVIEGLQLQIAELSQRLASLEGAKAPSSNSLEQNTKGNATFLGTKYQKPEVVLDSAETSRNARFLGNEYNVTDAKVKMKSDGTKKTFLGREFGGQTLDQ